MGVTGIIINNFSEIIAMGVMFFAGYNVGWLKYKYLPNVHLNPLRWFKRS